MRSKVIQIAWHDKEPIFTIDTHSSGRIATGGQDKEVKIWKLGSHGVVEYLCGMTRHGGAVNCVRWSPDEALLASAGDDGFVFIWKLGGVERCVEPITSSTLAPEKGEEKEQWTIHKSIKAPANDVYDVSWSADSWFIVGGSTENTVFVGSARSGEVLNIIRDHGHFVQGVAWDPRNRFVVTQSSDQTARVYRTVKDGSAKLQFKCVIKELHVPSSSTDRQKSLPPNKRQKIDGDEGVDDEGEDGGAETKETRQKMFLNESAPTFFRRPGWSPDGSILVVPAGVTHGQVEGGGTAPNNTAWMFSRGRLNRPFAHVPGHSRMTVAARFNPIVFAGAANRPRMIFAVATLGDVAVYSTEGAAGAIASAAGMHLAEITDLAWTKDGRALLVSSRDGYVSILEFDERELGEPLAKEYWPPSMAKAAKAREQKKVGPTTAAAAAEEESSDDAEVVQVAQSATQTPVTSSPVKAASVAPTMTTTTPKKRIQPTLISWASPQKGSPAPVSAAAVPGPTPDPAPAPTASDQPKSQPQPKSS